MQFHFGPAYFVENGFADYDGHAFTLGPVLISPRSRGRIELASAARPRNRASSRNTLAEPADVGGDGRGYEARTRDRRHRAARGGVRARSCCREPS